jgi:large subunit ribosomal protein L29
MSSGPNRQATELREFSDEELVSQLREAKQELFNLRFQSATGQLDNNARLRTVRHRIARIYTVMRERELNLSQAPVEVEASEVAAS